MPSGQTVFTVVKNKKGRAYFESEAPRPVKVPVLYAGLAHLNAPVLVEREGKSLTEGRIQYSEDIPQFYGFELPKTQGPMTTTLIPEQFQSGDRVVFPSVPRDVLRGRIADNPQVWKRSKWDKLA